ncbi:alpha/beta hydrolase [Thiomicrorhabdus aquaedulcis]|uniref:alpha/beta hydrolase n=1 Tax=Thiomicrorhabdus aquaedulcis TaxID=2211106 RepID=UPI000FDBEC66|nr:alpha/beta hydrolase [Thiomicrorhabdus aquaedulcis]
MKWNQLLSISLLALGLCGVPASQSLAQDIILPITPSNIKAEAHYLLGEAEKPAVLILHGFLTTNQFHTVVAMATALHDEGYTTLSPTLTLDISQRKSSVKCNSIHTHTLEKDVLEVAQWVKWLNEQGHKKVVVLGHSSGSQELLEMLHTQPQLNIAAAVFTSLFYLNGEELGSMENEIVFAQNALKQAKPAPQKYSFLFCKNNYFATPESFLSYMKLDRAYILERLTNLTIPSYTIMGGADKRYQSTGRDWLTLLEKTGTKLTVVEGANHFFSSEYEFTLQERIVEILNALE